MKKFISINPVNDVKEHCAHVRILFADGEVCSSKGGECWGMRGMHMFSMAICDISLVPDTLKDLFDSEYSGYPCVYILDTYEEENRICEEYRALLQEAIDA